MAAGPGRGLCQGLGGSANPHSTLVNYFPRCTDLHQDGKADLLVWEWGRSRGAEPGPLTARGCCLCWACGYGLRSGSEHDPLAARIAVGSGGN